MVNWVSFALSFFLERLHPLVLHIFSLLLPVCTTIRITLEPCALNAEFQHFILRFNKISLLWGHTERGDKRGVWKQAPKRGWRQGDFLDNSIHLISFPFLSFLVQMFWSCNLNVLLIDIKVAISIKSNQNERRKNLQILGIWRNSKELIVLFS